MSAAPHVNVLITKVTVEVQVVEALPAERVEQMGGSIRRWSHAALAMLPVKVTGGQIANADGTFTLVAEFHDPGKATPNLAKRPLSVVPPVTPANGGG